MSDGAYRQPSRIIASPCARRCCAADDLANVFTDIALHQPRISQCVLPYCSLATDTYRLTQALSTHHTICYPRHPVWAGAEPPVTTDAGGSHCRTFALVAVAAADFSSRQTPSIQWHDGISAIHRTHQADMTGRQQTHQKSTSETNGQPISCSIAYSDLFRPQRPPSPLTPGWFVLQRMDLRRQRRSAYIET
jgi:hypothetical protein